MEERLTDETGLDSGAFVVPGITLASASAGTDTRPARRPARRPATAAASTPQPVRVIEEAAPTQEAASKPVARHSSAKKVRAAQAARELLEASQEVAGLLHPDAPMRRNERYLIEKGLVAQAERNPDAWIKTTEGAGTVALIVGVALYARRLYKLARPIDPAPPAELPYGEVPPNVSHIPYTPAVTPTVPDGVRSGWTVADARREWVENR